MKLALIGGGRMGEALLTGLLRAGWAEPGELAVIEKLDERRAALRAAFPGVTIADDPVETTGVVVAVKPADVPDACRAAADAGCTRALSIAAGVPLATLESAF